MMTMKRLWLVAVLTLCVGATASAYDLTVALSEHGSVGFSVGGTAVTTAGAGEVVTVTVTPATGYAQKEVTARAYTSWEAARARRRAPDLMDDITVTKQQDGTWQFTMPEANVQVKVSYVQIVDYDDGEVTKDEDGYTVNLTENASNSNPDPLPDDVDLVNLTYKRELTAPGTEEGSGDIEIDDQPANLFTVCLPFVPNTDAVAKYYTLSSVSGETLFFEEVAVPASHTPYLVAVFGNVNFTEECSNLDISSMDINSTTVEGYTFKGTFTGLKNDAAQGLYILQRNNKWGKVTSGSVYIPPFRAYVEAPNNAPLLSGDIGDGNATGIRNIRTTDLNGTEHWYDLSGRRIATPTRGINIFNGKKFVIK